MSEVRPRALALVAAVAAIAAALLLPACSPAGAAGIRPAPDKAADDRGLAFRDGCHLKNTKRKRSPRCVYGNASSPTTVVLFGDSHGLQYFPTLYALARSEGWRLVSLTRAGCTSADVHYARRCDRWRRFALRRIARERPDLVVVSNATSDKYRVTRGGRTLSRRASQPVLERGFTRTLRRLRGTGAQVAVIRDQPFAPPRVVRCVGRHLDRPERCAFAPRRSERRAFDAVAARRVDGVTLVDPKDALCPTGPPCPAVMNGLLVYRNDYHLSATFAASLAGWLGAQLPDLAAERAKPATGRASQTVPLQGRSRRG